jgi:hypothetical protein
LIIFSIFIVESKTPVSERARKERKEFLSIASPRIYPPFHITEPELEAILAIGVVPVPVSILIPSRAVMVEVFPVPLLASIMEVFPERARVPERVLFT